MNFSIQSLSLGILGTNCYLIIQDQQVIVVDPGGDYDALKHQIESQSLSPIAIILTHAHFDHIGAVEPLRKEYNIPVFMHESEKNWLTDPELNGSQLFNMGSIYSDKPAEKTLDEGKHQIEGFQFNVLHTPGHSPGSISLWFSEYNTLIAGDTLFQRSIGRTDLPFGDHEQLINSIRSKLFYLPDHTQVFPGHGPKTTINEEKQHNPFL